MSEDTTPADFIRTILAEDQKAGKHGGRVQTRFPPEPNGYLHIGHAKSICLNFGLAAEFDGQCNLRFDDTNPAKEEVEYVDAIRENLRWLGFDWGDREFYASDYFGKLHDYAVALIEKGAAFVCSLDAEQMREYRGTVHTTGKNSPDRDRSVEENLDLFARMRKGEFADGTYTLRAKIDMASSNINLRDPAIYRIRHEHHDRTGDDWPIYPMYDYAHCVSDSIEGITHSVCTLEFEHHRPLYDWYLDQLEIHHPQQIEFARLEVSYMMMSKRKLLSLVDDGVVDGWDDPRMPTLSGLRRRGFTPSAIRAFCERVGVAKFNATIEMALLEFCLREDLNKVALRRMAVLDPIKLVIENYPEGGCDELDAINNPGDESAGTRQIKFGKELYIERADFMEDAPKKYFRMAPGREVRLRYAFLVTCTGFEKDADGNITEVRATYDPETRGGSAPDGRKVKGTIHWVSKEHGLDAEVRLYEQLFAVENPAAEAAEKPIAEIINPDSLQVVQAKIEPCLADAKAGESIQFERTGYFCADSADHSASKPVFNRTVGLRDSWAKKQKKG